MSKRFTIPKNKERSSKKACRGYQNISEEQKV